MSSFSNKITKNQEIAMNKLTIKIPKLKQRVVWNMKPTTRIKQSKKIYSRTNKEIKNDQQMKKNLIAFHLDDN